MCNLSRFYGSLSRLTIADIFGITIMFSWLHFRFHEQILFARTLSLFGSIAVITIIIYDMTDKILGVSSASIPRMIGDSGFPEGVLVSWALSETMTFAGDTIPVHRVGYGPGVKYDVLIK